MLKLSSKLIVRAAGKDGLYKLMSLRGGLALLTRIDATGNALVKRAQVIYAIRDFSFEDEAAEQDYGAPQVPSLAVAEDTEDINKHIRNKKPGLFGYDYDESPEDKEEAPAHPSQVEPGPEVGKEAPAATEITPEQLAAFDEQHNSIIARYIDKTMSLTDYALSRITAPMNKAEVKARVLAGLFGDMFLLDGELADGRIPANAEVSATPSASGVTVTFFNPDNPEEQPYVEDLSNEDVYRVEAFIKQVPVAHVLNLIGSAELASIAPMVAKTAERITAQSPVDYESKEHFKLNWALKKSVWENYISKLFVSPAAKKAWRAAIDRASTATDYTGMLSGLSRRLSETIGGANDVGASQFFATTDNGDPKQGKGFVRSEPAVGTANLTGVPDQVTREGERLTDVLNFENYRKYIVNALAAGEFTGEAADDLMSRIKLLQNKLSDLAPENEGAYADPATPTDDTLMNSLFTQLEKIKLADVESKREAEELAERRAEKAKERAAKKAKETV